MYIEILLVEQLLLALEINERAFGLLSLMKEATIVPRLSNNRHGNIMIISIIYVEFTQFIRWVVTYGQRRGNKRLSSWHHFFKFGHLLD